MSRRQYLVVEQEVSILLSGSSQDEALRVERPVSHSSIEKIRDTKGTFHALIGKDSDAGKDWGQEEKGMTEDEMAGWYH